MESVPLDFAEKSDYGVNDLLRRVPTVQMASHNIEMYGNRHMRRPATTSEATSMYSLMLFSECRPSLSDVLAKAVNQDEAIIQEIPDCVGVTPERIMMHMQHAEDSDEEDELLSSQESRCDPLAPASDCPTILLVARDTAYTADAAVKLPTYQADGADNAFGTLSDLGLGLNRPKDPYSIHANTTIPDTTPPSRLSQTDSELMRQYLNFSQSNPSLSRQASTLQISSTAGTVVEEVHEHDTATGDEATREPDDRCDIRQQMCQTGHRDSLVSVADNTPAIRIAPDASLTPSLTNVLGQDLPSYNPTTTIRSACDNIASPLSGRKEQATRARSTGDRSSIRIERGYTEIGLPSQIAAPTRQLISHKEPTSEPVPTDLESLTYLAIQRKFRSNPSTSKTSDTRLLTPSKQFSGLHGYLGLRISEDKICKRPMPKMAPKSPRDSLAEERAQRRLQIQQAGSDGGVKDLHITSASLDAPALPKDLAQLNRFGSQRLLQNHAVSGALERMNIEIEYKEARKQQYGKRRSTKSGQGHQRQYLDADLILAANACAIFYDQNLIYRVTSVLADDGISVVQIPHWKLIVNTLHRLYEAFDKICIIFETNTVSAMQAGNVSLPAMKKALERLTTEIATFRKRQREQNKRMLDVEILHAGNAQDAAALARERIDQIQGSDPSLGQLPCVSQTLILS